MVLSNPKINVCIYNSYGQDRPFLPCVFQSEGGRVKIRRL